MVTHVNTIWCYNAPMNEHIRQVIKEKIAAEHKTQTQVAADIGVERQYLFRMLNEGVGDVPKRWQALLDYFGLEATVRPKGER